MVLLLNELIDNLKSFTKANDTGPADALWIKFSGDKTHKTVEYRTSDENQILHVCLDNNGALVAIEIFP